MPFEIFETFEKTSVELYNPKAVKLLSQNLSNEIFRKTKFSPLMRKILMALLSYNEIHKTTGNNVTLSLQMNLFENSELSESFSNLPKACMNIITQKCFKFFSNVVSA